MNRKFILKIIIDVCMTVCLLLLMPYSLLGETLHEWLGIVMFVLFVTHHVLNRKWMAAVTKGKYTPFRIVQTLIVFVMLVLMLGSMVSGVLLSNHIFRAVRIAGISMAARQVHMFCAYFGMLVMSVHLGLHWNMVVNMTGKLFLYPSAKRTWIARAIAILLAGYGVYAGHKRKIGAYLLMKMHFVFYDYTENVLFFVFDYMAVTAFIVFITYYVSKFLRKRGKRNK